MYGAGFDVSGTGELKPQTSVPDGAIAYVNLITKQGYVDGVGAVGVETLIGSDPQTEASLGPSAFFPDAVTEYGYEFYLQPAGSMLYPALIGALRIAAVGGKSFVIKFQSSPYNLRTEDYVNIYCFPAAGFSGPWCEGYELPDRDGQANYGTGQWQVPGLNVWRTRRAGPGIVNALGMTILALDHLDFAANNQVKRTHAINASDTPQPTAVVTIMPYWGAIASIAAYDTLTLDELAAKTTPTLDTVVLSAMQGVGEVITRPVQLMTPDLALSANGWTDQDDGTAGSIAAIADPDELNYIKSSP